MLVSISITLLAVSLHQSRSCNTDHDNSIRQRIFYKDQCKCREYVDTYATCYYVGCKSFPKFFQTSLKCFKLQDTGLAELYPRDFENLTSITGLYIDDNKYLRRIRPETLGMLKQLKVLSISYNKNLVSFEEDIFRGLESLETLSLIRNGCKEIKDFTLSIKTNFLPNLRTVKLMELNCSRVDEFDFKNLKKSGLEKIQFDDSQLEYIHPKALSPLENLRNLSLSETLLKVENLIEILEEITEHEIPLVSLNLKGWGFKIQVPVNLFNLIANMTIKELILTRNQFNSIDVETFPPMPNIENLALEQSMIADVEKNSFSNFPNLQQLRLKQNKLISIPEGVLVPTLKLLDISGNTRPTNSYFTVDENIFLNTSFLTTLILSTNNLRRLYNQTLRGLDNLKELYLSNCNIVVIADNAFVQVPNLEQLDLGENRFFARTFRKETFAGLSKLKQLSLENCRIEYLTAEGLFSNLISLETLNLRHNILMEITPEFIASIPTLKMLHVDDNKIKMWHKRLFQNNVIENLTISRNTFSYLSEAMLNDFGSLEALDVSDNPFHCDCEHFIESFNVLSSLRLRYVLKLLNQTTTYCLLPEADENTTVIDFYYKTHNICKELKITKLINYLIPSLIALILLLSLITLSYVYRWHIRYWIFLTKLAIAKRSQFKKRQYLKYPGNYIYDAFVSYSSEDRNFVIRLVSMLENYEPFLKLCVYERDFEIGTIISESVLECLSRSRKTLLIISNSYIRSQWCTWEAQVAENHRLFFENEKGECVNDSLIMVKLGNISSGNISPMLKYLMKTRIYLQWDSNESKQQLFWAKLRNALAPALSESQEEKGVVNKAMDVKL